jgi:sialic acid synthase
LRELVIDGIRIADDTDCYVIAEVGHNHQGSVETCKRMFDAAKWAGCNAVKLQKRDNKTLYTEEFYNSPYNSENAFGPTYGLHREALEFNWEQYKELQGYALSIGLTFFATAFDVPSAYFLYDLGVPAIKIASGDFENAQLLDVADRYRKGNGIPVIVSTGGQSSSSVLNAGNVDAVLHCTSGYPAKYEELNLRVIPVLCAALQDYIIGWSAHDTGIAMAPVAYALGARIIEKHFTLDRSMKGTDQAMSLEPGAMKKMIENLKLCRLALGDGIKRQYDSEIEPLKKQRKNANGQIDGCSVPSTHISEIELR